MEREEEKKGKKGKRRRGIESGGGEDYNYNEYWSLNFFGEYRK